MNAISRLDDGFAARWWRSVDHALLFIVAALMMFGIVLGFAAGPGAAARLGIDDALHFPMRQLAFLGPAVVVLLGASMLTPLQTRRLCALMFAAAFILLAGAVMFAPEINGAKRWVSLGFMSFQPSEILKPGFVVVAAWMLAEGARDPRFPGAAIATALYAFCAMLLALQPDYGQAGLLTAVWMAMFFVAGGSLVWLTLVAVIGAAGFIGGYFFSPHVAKRIDAFLSPEGGGNYQVDKALEAIGNGGLLPRGGADAGSVKLSLPDAQTDFIFAVAAEELGLILCVVIMSLFAAFVIRSYVKASALKSVFARTAVCGLAALIGLQSLINIGVNLRALPAKGMTLPFISSGGSSLLAAALTVGLVLSLTRRQTHAARRKDVMP